MYIILILLITVYNYSVYNFDYSTILILYIILKIKVKSIHNICIKVIIGSVIDSNSHSFYYKIKF